MADFDVTLRKVDEVPDEVRKRAIFKCYTYLLSLPSPREKQAEPDDLAGDAATSSADAATAIKAAAD